jgi:hypothetical protein
MSKKSFWFVMLAACLVIPSVPRLSLAAQTAAERFAGSWSGTYEGDSSGRVVMAITVGDGGKAAVHLEVTDNSDGATQRVDAKSVVLDGDKAVVMYDAPGSDLGEVRLEGVFSGDAASGTWTFHDRTGRSIKGTWNAARPGK